MSFSKIASLTCIALTLGACQSLFQPATQKPLELKRDAWEQVKPGCNDPDCPLVNIDTVHFPDEPQLDSLIERRLLQMTHVTPLPTSLKASGTSSSPLPPAARAVTCKPRYSSSMTAW